MFILFLKILCDPENKVILKSSLNNLVKEVGRYQLIDVGMREIVGEGLKFGYEIL